MDDTSPLPSTVEKGSENIAETVFADDIDIKNYLKCDLALHPIR